MEIWKDIKGYKGLYQVSNLGRVKSLRFGKKKIRKISLDKDGYSFIGLRKNGSIKKYFVHRLEYEAFYGKIPYWMVINHKDENPANNQLSNLMVCTVKENNNWGNHNKKLSKPIFQYDINGNFIKEWSSAAEIERQLGFDDGHISDCCLGKRKQANGYIWKRKKAT